MSGQFLAQTSSVVERIQSAADYFQNPSLAPGQVLLLVGLFGAVIVCIAGAWLLFKYRRARDIYIPVADVREPGKIAQILDLCIMRRNKIEFKIVSRQNSGQFVSGMPVAVRDGQLILSLSVPFSASQEKLKGERVHCYFKVQENKRTSFFNFLGTINRVLAGSDGFLELRIGLPETLVAGQKRHFLRLDPNDDFILDLAIWPEYIDSATDWKTRIDDFPPPALSNEDKSLARIKLKDISAAGVRLILDKAELSRGGIIPNRGAHFMLRLNLWDPAELRELSLWMICRIQKYVSASGDPQVDIGAQFIAWSQLKNQETRELSWVKLSHEEDDVLPLGNWVAKRYLEEYRKHLGD